MLDLSLRIFCIEKIFFVLFSFIALNCYGVKSMLSMCFRVSWLMSLKLLLLLFFYTHEHCEFKVMSYCKINFHFTDLDFLLYLIN